MIEPLERRLRTGPPTRHAPRAAGLPVSFIDGHVERIRTPILGVKGPNGDWPVRPD